MAGRVGRGGLLRRANVVRAAGPRGVRRWCHRGADLRRRRAGRPRALGAHHPKRPRARPPDPGVHPAPPRTVRTAPRRYGRTSGKGDPAPRVRGIHSSPARPSVLRSPRSSSGMVSSGGSPTTVSLSFTRPVRCSRPRKWRTSVDTTPHMARVDGHGRVMRTRDRSGHWSTCATAVACPRRTPRAPSLTGRWRRERPPVADEGREGLDRTPRGRFRARLVHGSDPVIGGGSGPWARGGRPSPSGVDVLRELAGDASGLTTDDLHALIVDNALALKHGIRPPRDAYGRRTDFLLDGIRGQHG